MANEAAERGRSDLGIPGLGAPTFVGRGGAAVVYRAEQHSLQRTVAVKVLTSSWDDAVARRFDREQRAMGRLSSTRGIVPVYSSGRTADGSAYLMMSFYADGSLEDWSKKHGPLEWKRAAEIIMDVAVALGQAHNIGIVHRDLKPANILLTRSGSPVLGDFGLARLGSDESGDTTSLTFTPAYCPPEALDDADPDPNVDTYALAATFWALVQGCPPFTDGGRALAMEAILKRVLTEPVPVLGGVPGPISEFIARSMSKDPTLRPRTGSEFATEFEKVILQAQGRVPVSHEPVLSSARPSKWTVASMATTGRVAAVATLVAGVVVAGLALRADPSDAEASAIESVPAAIGSDPDIIVVPAGQSIRLQTLATDASSPKSLELRRAVQAAISDYGDIHGYTVEQRSIVEVACGAGAEFDELLDVAAAEAVALIGSICLERTTALAAAGSERDIVWISPDLRLPELTSLADGRPGASNVEGFFRTSLNDHFQGAVAAQFALEELDATSAVVVHGGTPGHQDIADSFARAFSTRGETTVVELAESSSVSDVARTADETTADVVFMVLSSSSATDFAEALDARPSSPRALIGVESVLSDESARSAGMEGAYVITPLNPPEDAVGASGRSFDALVSDYERLYGETPADLYQFATAYDATFLMLGAVEAAAEVSSDGITIERSVLRKTLESAASRGLTGLLECNHLGDCGSQAMSILQVDGSSRSSTLENVVKIFDRS